MQKGKMTGITSSGRGKQFAGAGSPGPFLKKTVAKATAAMSNGPMPSETSASMARKDARKNTVKGGGRRVF